MPYDPDDIDLFFIVDGQDDLYLMDTKVVAGRSMISLRAYPNYLCGRAHALVAGSEPPETQ